LKKKALIIGITSRDGAYLANLLLSKNYKIHGICRNKNFKNLVKLKILKNLKIKIIKNYSKVQINEILKKKFNEIYFLGGQPNVKASFDQEYETIESHVKPVQTILEFIKNQNGKKSKFLFSSSSEIFGNYDSKKKNSEINLKKPVSPYGLAKLIGLEIIKSYRKMFNLPVFSIIFFNHESPLKTNKFSFKKIARTINGIKKKKMKKLFLKNINIKRDWRWEHKYMERCIKIMNSKKVNDYIIATEKTISLNKINNI